MTLSDETASEPTGYHLRLLEQVLSSMHEQDQAILVPYYLYGYSSEELGEIFACSPNAMRMRISNAIGRTRKVLGLLPPLPEGLSYKWTGDYVASAVRSGGRVVWRGHAPATPEGIRKVLAERARVRAQYPNRQGCRRVQ